MPLSSEAKPNIFGGATGLAGGTKLNLGGAPQPPTTSQKAESKPSLPTAPASAATVNFGQPKANDGENKPTNPLAAAGTDKPKIKVGPFGATPPEEEKLGGTLGAPRPGTGSQDKKEEGKEPGALTPSDSILNLAKPATTAAEGPAPAAEAEKLRLE